MTTVQIRFIAGAFHATPWGRHVNEGEVEWPPSPFRLARALADAAFRRFPDWTAERTAAALACLSGTPEFCLPPASRSHVRLYQHSNTQNATARQKILDAFVVVDRESSLLMRLDPRWQHTAEQLEDLHLLLKQVDYLGRSESWTEMGLVQPPQIATWNATPVDPMMALPTANQRLQLACLRPPESYDSMPNKPVAGKGKKARELTWLEAVCLSSDDIQDMGLSHHPAMVWCDYSRPASALDHALTDTLRHGPLHFCFARFSLTSTLLPRVVDTVAIAERVRRHLMGIHKKLMGDDPTRVSPLFSGKAPDGKPLRGHQHLQILPRDDDFDGRIDHLELWSPRPFSLDELAVLDRLRSVWQDGGRPDIEFLLVDLMQQQETLFGNEWVSETPFVTSRHYRQGRGEFLSWLASELVRELELKGLPTPVSIEWNLADQARTPPVRWASYLRSRKGQHPMPGYGARLVFETPVSGPFAVGSLCHYGMGRFRPETPLQPEK